MSKTYRVRAKRWGGGWELHIDGIGVTQSRTLSTAERQARDYLETLLDEDVSGAVVEVEPDLGDLVERAAAARRHAAEAARAQEAAAGELRDVVRDLKDVGLSTSDVAEVLHVSRGRVSQLVKV